MIRCFAVLVLGVALGLTAGAYGQGSPTGERPDYTPLVLRVACGGVLRPGCAKVLPKIAAKAAQSGIDLKPMTGGIPFDTVTYVCDGQAAAAIVQRDAIAQIGRQPPCLGHFDFVGRPLYPIYAVLVARADAPFHSLDDIASGGRRRVIMAGAEGTGGQITLGFLLRSNANLQRSIAVTMGDPEVGLQRVATGAIDGYFAVEPLDSDTLDRIRRTVDPHGKPLYTFIDIRPVQEFFRIGDGAGHCVYRLTALDFGGPAPVTTVSVDAVLILGHGFRDAHARSGPRAADALDAAIDGTRDAFLADMKSPGDWRTPDTSCQ